jgi:beta-phosphoglucomutase
MAVRALLFDFNGTLSDDEQIQCEIFQELFEEAGRPLSVEEYFSGLAGLSDPEIVERWLGRPDPELADERTRRFLARAADGSTVPAHVREAVLAAATRVPVAVVSGAARAEVEAVVRGAGIDVFAHVVAAEDVAHGKPDPESYLLALELLGLEAADAVGFEDTDVGIASARAAGLRCVAVAGTLDQARLTGADEVVPRLDASLVDRVLSW